MTADEVFIKHLYLAEANSYVPQHAHRYDHTTFVAAGAVAVWRDGVYDGEHHAPSPLFIRAGVKHMFKTLTDRTVLLCIHNGSRPDVAAVLAEHQLDFAE